MPSTTRKQIAWALAAFVLVTVAACANSEREQALSKSLSEARVLLEAARSSEARKVAAGELSVAEEKLSESRTALQQENYDLAERRLAEAEINIAVARAKVDHARVQSRLRQLVPPNGSQRNNPLPHNRQGE